MRVSEPVIRRPITPPSANSAIDVANVKNAGIAPRPSRGRRERAGARKQLYREKQSRNCHPELKQAERLVLPLGEGLEDRVEDGPGDRQRADDRDGGAKEGVVDRFLAEAPSGEDPPVGQKHDRIDELHQMPPAPDQEFARDHEVAIAGEQDPGEGEGDQRHEIDEAAYRHGERQRRQRSRSSGQIDKEADDRREHASRKHEEPEIVGRMTDERDVVGEFRLGGVDERRGKQAWKGDQRDPLPDPAERRGAGIAAARPLRRRGDQEGENGHEPDDQREHDMDDESLVKEPDRPERRFVHTRDARQRQQQGEDACNRQRADGEPRPAGQFALERSDGRSGDAEPKDRRGGRLRRAAHCVSSPSADRDGPP